VRPSWLDRAGLEVQYSLPTLDLTKDEVYSLWDKISDLFAADSTQPNFTLEHSIGVKSSEGTKLEAENLTELRKSSFLTNQVKELNLRFSSHFGPTQARESRRLWLWVTDNTSLTLDGSNEWTQRAHGLLGDWLKRKSSKNKWPRALTAILLWAFPVTVFVLLGIRFPYLFDASAIGIIIWTYISIWKVWDAASKMYPVPALVIGASFEWAWYVRWANRILVGVAISIVAALLLSLIR